MRLDNKIAVVTGAGQGIGKAIVQRFAQEGAKLAICDINEEALAHSAQYLNDAGHTVFARKVDVTQRPQVDEFILAVLQQFGSVDILINNAGIMRDAPLHLMSEPDWDLVIETNLKGCFNCCQSVVDVMRDKGYGRILNVSGANVGSTGQASYAASKAGIDGLTRTLARELGAKGITVNAVAPGSIQTEMFQSASPQMRQTVLYGLPLKRFGTPAEVANLCLFLASDEASYITGQVIHCDGGMNI